MGSRQRKIQQRQQRRRKKKNETRIFSLRRAQGLSSHAHSLHACVVNHDWREDGKASIYLARSVGPGRVTMAAFLVDLWAMGLKDAWGRVDIATGEFDEIARRVDEALETGPLNVGTARHIVHGGIELAQALGFRLPRKFERWVTILGPLPEGEEPDGSLFCPGGRVRLICSMRDLEARLVGTTPDKFLARANVDFICGDDDFTLIDDEDDGVDEAVEHMEEAFLARVREWCFANGQTPHPLLPHLISAMMESVYQSAPEDLDPDEDVPALTETDADEVTARMDAFLQVSFADQPAELAAAMAQFGAFMRSMDSPEELFETLGLEEGLAADDE